ncbi:MAG: hypothetical protein J6B85_02640 [Lachnospiraceae bacterium]|nr:hypothetical protein [Lachnospiraceae bacterium]
MKKFGKFLMYVVSAAAVVGGVLLVLKKFVFKDEADSDDFDDFEDDMDELDDAEDDAADTREYVSIKITSPAEEAKEASAKESPAEETAAPEETPAE